MWSGPANSISVSTEMTTSFWPLYSKHNQPKMSYVPYPEASFYEQGEAHLRRSNACLASIILEHPFPPWKASKLQSGNTPGIQDLSPAPSLRCHRKALERVIAQEMCTCLDPSCATKGCCFIYTFPASDPWVVTCRGIQREGWCRTWKDSISDPSLSNDA